MQSGKQEIFINGQVVKNCHLCTDVSSKNEDKNKMGAYMSSNYNLEVCLPGVSHMRLVVHSWSTAIPGDNTPILGYEHLLKITTVICQTGTEKTIPGDIITRAPHKISEVELQIDLGIKHVTVSMRRNYKYTVLSHNPQLNEVYLHHLKHIYACIFKD